MNTVIRHHGTDRRSVPHPVLSHRCRTTLDPTLVTCQQCIDAPARTAVVLGEVISHADQSVKRQAMERYGDALAELL